jgi:ribose 5-phosphate isomerase B
MKNAEMEIAPLFIASDHAGFALKQYLIEKSGFKMEDLGTNGLESCDYPLFANRLCKRVLDSVNGRGILICSTGIGMSIAANRHRGIRAALCFDARMAQLSRCHNDSNVLILGSRVVRDDQTALGCLRAFLEAKFEGGRHVNRLKLLDSGG